MTCQLLVLTDVFVRPFAENIEQSAPGRSRHAAAEAAETRVKSVWKFGFQISAYVLGQFSGHFSGNFSI